MIETAAGVAPDPGSVTVSLRIRHPSIDPGEITQLLRLTPDHSWARGEPRRSDAGMPLGGTRHDSYWIATLPGVSAGQWRTSDTGVEFADEAFAIRAGAAPGAMDQVQVQTQMLSQIRRHKLLFERVIAEGGEVAFVAEIESGPGASFKLDPALMRQMGALGLRLEFEFA